jgi:hypothetical protein
VGRSFLVLCLPILGSLACSLPVPDKSIVEADQITVIIDMGCGLPSLDLLPTTKEKTLQKFL